MPYITRESRSTKEMSNFFGGIPRFDNAKPGDLNFMISSLADFYIADKNNQKPSYTLINEVIGVLECVKLELYRRIAASYEDEKLKENGEVYLLLKGVEGNK
jgi:hypothetical protein